MFNHTIRTDLALEARENIGQEIEQMNGIKVSEYYSGKNKNKVTKVTICSKNAEKAMGKPMGTYVTIEAAQLSEDDEGDDREISECLAKELKRLLPELEKEQSVLVVGLGNREVTADALGPQVTDQLHITRHIIKIYGRAAYGEGKVHEISSLEPGVMAKTGMETVEIIRGVVKDVKPDLIFVVDALAARSIHRLNRTIQISDTGIWPGSGVGNHRHPLSKESLGVPVVAIGVPTVVDAATVARDASNLKADFAELKNMYLAGKDIDAVIRKVSFTISEGINIALTFEE